MSNLIAKDDMKFVDDIRKAYVDNDNTITANVKIALQAFMNEPKAIIKKRIQAIGASVSTDFDMLTTNAFNVNVQVDNFDLGYERAFRVVPKDPDKDFWEIAEVTNGLNFRKVQEGQRLPVEGMSGEVANAYVDYYGGALGWTDRMIRYRKLSLMADKAMAFRNNFWVNKANNHYLLLVLAAGLLANYQPWQGVAADGQLRRDIQSLNNVAYILTNRNKNKGYGDMANAPLIVYANPIDRARLNAAKIAQTNQTLGVPQSIGVTVDWPIDFVFTYNANIEPHNPIMVLPGRKLQRVDDMAPTTYTSPQDILTLNYVQSVWAIYGAAVGDTDQVIGFTLG